MDIANRQLLVDYINSHAADILAEKHTMPLTIGSASTSFVAGSALNAPSVWVPPLDANANPDLRHKFAVNTCNGCHSSVETRTSFLHVGTRQMNSPSSLSKFMTGLKPADNFHDPVSGQLRTFDDLTRRQTDLGKVLGMCPLPAPAPALQAAKVAAAPAVANGTPLPLTSKPRSLLPAGTGRVH